MGRIITRRSHRRWTTTMRMGNPWILTDLDSRRNSDSRGQYVGKYRFHSSPSSILFASTISSDLLGHPDGKRFLSMLPRIVRLCHRRSFLSCRFHDRSPLIVQSIAISSTRPPRLQSVDNIFSYLRNQQPAFTRDTRPDCLAIPSTPEPCYRMLNPRRVSQAAPSLYRHQSHSQRHLNIVSAVSVPHGPYSQNKGKLHIVLALDKVGATLSINILGCRDVAGLPQLPTVNCKNLSTSSNQL